MSTDLDPVTERLPLPRPPVDPPRPGPSPQPPTPERRRAVVRAGLSSTAAAIVGAVAAIAQVLDYLDGKAVLLVIAMGVVLVVAPLGPLLRRGEGAVRPGLALLLCLLLVVGGVVVGYGVRGGFVPGTPWAPGITGDAGPRIPAPAASGPVPAPVTAAPAVAAPVETVALTDSTRTDLVVDDNGRLGVATTPVAVAGRSLTDAFRTYCSCARDAAYEGRVVIALGGTYRRLDAVLGVDRSSPDSGSVRVTIRDVASGRVLLDREVGFAAAEPVSLDVTGVQRLEIVLRGPLGGVNGVVGEPRVTT